MRWGLTQAAYNGATGIPGRHLSGERLSERAGREKQKQCAGPFSHPVYERHSEPSGRTPVQKIGQVLFLQVTTASPQHFLHLAYGYVAIWGWIDFADILIVVFKLVPEREYILGIPKPGKQIISLKQELVIVLM